MSLQRILSISVRCLSLYCACMTSLYAQQGDEVNDFVIVNPTDAETQAQHTQDIINPQGGQHVRDIYDQKANGELRGSDKVNQQLATGILTRDSIIDYGVYVLKFLSQLGILVGSLMFVYVGYQYAASSLLGTSPDSSLIKNAIYGVLIIIFSYAIMKILTRAFLT